MAFTLVGWTCWTIIKRITRRTVISSSFGDQGFSFDFNSQLQNPSPFKVFLCTDLFNLRPLLSTEIIHSLELSRSLRGIRLNDDKAAFIIEWIGVSFLIELSIYEDLNILTSFIDSRASIGSKSADMDSLFIQIDLAKDVDIEVYAQNSAFIFQVTQALPFLVVHIIFF